MKKLPSTLTGQPSGKTLKVYVIAANDAGQAAPSDAVSIVVPQASSPHKIKK